MRRDAHSKSGTRLETACHRIELGASHDLLQRSDRPHPAVRDQHDRAGKSRHLGDSMADIDDRNTRLVAQALDIREDLILTWASSEASGSSISSSRGPANKARPIATAAFRRPINAPAGGRAGHRFRADRRRHQAALPG